MRAIRTSLRLSRRLPSVGSSASKSCLPIWRRNYSTDPVITEAKLQAIKDEMLQRPVQWTRDVMSPTNSTLLNIVLADFVPSECLSPYMTVKSTPNKMMLPMGHHLVYFPLQKTISQLCPDGTDPLHSPGDPFVRRMWAGGSIEFHENFRLGSGAVDCKESIEDVTFKTVPGQEKIFVTVLRQYQMCADRTQDIWTFPRRITERRTLVFMRDVSKEQARENLKKSEKGRERIVESVHEPDYSFTLTPTPRLLFYFSALSFNAHSIHLDPEFCREVEGHRNLLVHGPLSLILMLGALKSRIKASEEEIMKIDYRNLAPLYANEPLRVCIRRLSDTSVDPLPDPRGDKALRAWDVWIEDRDGGLAVRGTATTKVVKKESALDPKKTPKKKK